MPRSPSVPRASRPSDPSVRKPEVTTLPGIVAVDGGIQRRIPCGVKPPVWTVRCTQPNEQAMPAGAGAVERDPRWPAPILDHHQPLFGKSGGDQVGRVYGTDDRVP